MPNYRVSLRQTVRGRSDGALGHNINSNGPKYGLESNIWDNFISESIYKESGSHHIQKISQFIQRSLPHTYCSSTESMPPSG